jgi:hypothetical protein
MSLSTKTIDRLFERLTLAYGAQFMAQYDGMPVADVKTDWCQWLSAFGDRLPAIGWALENLPERPTNAVAFRNLCRSAPAPATVLLPEPAPNPERMRAELEKLAPLLAAKRDEPPDGRAWARRILAADSAGEKVNRTSLMFARQALGMPVARARA